MKSAWMIVVALAALAAGCAGITEATAEMAMTRGERWVRSHPLTIMGLVQIEKTFDVDEYRDAGLGPVLLWKHRPGILDAIKASGLDYHHHVRPLPGGLTDELKANVREVVEAYPGCIAFIVHDEPGRPQMPLVAPTIEWLKREYPDTLVYTNGFPAWEGSSAEVGVPEEEGPYDCRAYYSDIADIMKPDVLMFDIYPFGKDDIFGSR